MAQLQNDTAGIDGNLSVATSTTCVTEAVTEAIDELDVLGGWISEIDWPYSLGTLVPLTYSSVSSSMTRESPKFESWTIDL